MAQPFIISSLNGGELSPAMYGRTDVQKYHSSLALCRNFIVDVRGGILNRSGTRYVGAVAPGRLIPFQFSTQQTYVLVFGAGVLQFVTNGGLVLEPTQVITGVATDGTVTIVGHGYAAGDEVFITGLTGAANLNGRTFTLTNVTLNTFQVLDLYGNLVTPATAYVSGGTAARIYTLVTPYAFADLPLLKYAQSADVMTLCHPSYPPMSLARTDNANWQLSPITFAPAAPRPTNLTATPSTGGTTVYRYVVTALIGVVESRGSTPATSASATMSTTTGATSALSWTAVPGATQYYVYRTGELPGLTPSTGAALGFIGATIDTTFVDNNIAPNFSTSPPRANNPFVNSVISNPVIVNGGAGYLHPTLTVNDNTGSGATLAATLTAGVITGVSIITPGVNYTSPTVTVTDGGTQAAATANATFLGGGGFGPHGVVYRVDITKGGSGYVNPVAVLNNPGAGTGATFSVTVTNGSIMGVTILTGGQNYPHEMTMSFIDSGVGTGSGAVITLGVTTTTNYPTCSTYFQQRQVFGGTITAPDQLNLSKSGDYLNMDFSSPTRADDAIQVNIAATQVNAIRSLVPFTSLLVFSSGSCWKVDSGQGGGALTPFSISALPQSFTGASNVPPIVINHEILYVQDKQAVVRDLTYNFYQNIYTGNDISVLANHLFFGHQIVEWAYAQEPHKVVWCVRDDGVLLSMTYLKEQEVYAWCRHDTVNGLFKSVCVVSEGSEDVPYFLVERAVNGQTLHYVERLQSRLLGGDASGNIPGDLSKAWFVDAGLAHTGAPVSAVSGLEHLRGQTVSILADGSVMTQQMVDSTGSVALDAAASDVRVGLPITAQAQSLYLDIGENPTMQTKRVHVNTVTVRVADTRGLKVGRVFDELWEIKERTSANFLGSPIPLRTMDERIVIDPRQSAPARVCVQQDQPLPAQIQALILELTIGDTP